MRSRGGTEKTEPGLEGPTVLGAGSSLWASPSEGAATTGRVMQGQIGKGDKGGLPRTTRKVPG